MGVVLGGPWCSTPFADVPPAVHAPAVLNVLLADDSVRTVFDSIDLAALESPLDTHGGAAVTVEY